jgi:hypothetical protein
VWFDLHAAQRMQTFNFFLVATAFLIAAYSTLLEKHRLMALVVALVGGWIAFRFRRLDNRTRQLIDAGRSVIAVSEERLAQRANISSLEILRGVEQPTKQASRYDNVSRYPVDHRCGFSSCRRIRCSANLERTLLALMAFRKAPISSSARTPPTMRTIADPRRGDAPRVQSISDLMQ